VQRPKVDNGLIEKILSKETTPFELNSHQSDPTFLNISEGKMTQDMPISDNFSTDTHRVQPYETSPPTTTHLEQELPTLEHQTGDTETSVPQLSSGQNTAELDSNPLFILHTNTSNDINHQEHASLQNTTQLRITAYSEPLSTHSRNTL
jgi:hypothetical protein